MKRDFLIRWITKEGEVIKQGMAHHIESTNDLIDVITFDLLPEIDFDSYEIEVAPVPLSNPQYAFFIDLQRDDFNFPNFKPSEQSPIRNQKNLRWETLGFINDIIFDSIFAESGRWEEMSEFDFARLRHHQKRKTIIWLNRMDGGLKPVK